MTDYSISPPMSVNGKGMMMQRSLRMLGLMDAVLRDFYGLG